ncbi:MAG: methionine ABC transporter permease [Bacillota bacterium]|nr:methionine ABC transporter permease [Bacillota bacterium]
MNKILELVMTATGETLYMVLITTFFAVLLGLPVGIILVCTAKGGIFENTKLYSVISYIVNMMRSIPFIILLIYLIGFTRLLIGTAIGTNATVIPLIIASIPFFARIAETTLLEVDKGVIEAAQAMGASNWQIIVHVLLPESLSSMVLNITVTIINIIGYSAMAGVIGGGGLGDLAIRYGYVRNRQDIMNYTIILLILLVQIIQSSGNYISKRVK